MSRRRTLLEDEDLLQEILLRLPPNPSSIPRASLVCKQWRSLLFDPRFHLRFRERHRKPPLLGFFDKEWKQAPVFTPMLDPPDRIPVALPENFIGSESWDIMGGRLTFSFLGCRHGIALFLDHQRREAVLWDPLTGTHRRVAPPPGFGDDGKDNFIRNAAVFAAADGDNQHGQGGSHMSPFKLVFAWDDPKRTKVSVCIYESKYGVWGDIISATTAYVISRYTPSVLVGNTLCWLLSGGNILEFDFKRLTLVVIEKPTDAHATGCDQTVWTFQILRGEDNGLGLAILSRITLSIQLWARKSNCGGVVSWVLQNIVQLDELFSRPLCPGAGKHVLMPGYDEDTNVIFLSTVSHDFILQLESMQFRYIRRQEYESFRMYFPLVDNGPFVPGREGHQSRFWNRD